MLYEWDEAKRKQNIAKHGLDFLDADMVMENPLVMLQSSARQGEARYQAVAYVFEVLAVLSVVFVPRGEVCRVVSFRPASQKERRQYHEWLETRQDE